MAKKPVEPEIDDTPEGLDPSLWRRLKRKSWNNDPELVEGAFWFARSSKVHEHIQETGEKFPYKTLAFADDEELAEGCIEYFMWCASHPLKESRPFAYEGHVTFKDVHKPRMMSTTGLCLYLGISTQTFHNYAKDDRFSSVVQWAKDVIRTQKLEGAASGFFNASIVQRVLGLADRHEHSGPDGSPLQTMHTDMDPKEATQKYQDYIRGSVAGEDE